jgi:CubicO group peptidase (beta-lactamase class C family)
MTDTRTTTALAGLDDHVEEAMSAWEVPGFALAVVKDGHVVHSRGYGVRELGSKEPVTDETVFCIASCTKAFTAAALGILVDEGKLGWDDPVAEHLPGFRLSDPYVSQIVTIRDLLAHRVGVRDVDDSLGFSREELIYRLRFDGPIDMFRSRWVYNSLHYLVAGQVIPAVTGTSWDEFVRERIFRPLAMAESSTSAWDLARAENKASSHVRQANGALYVDPITPNRVPNFDNDSIGPSASINSTARDMTRWLHLQLGGEVAGRRLLSEEVIREMHAPQALLEPEVAPERALAGELMLLSHGLGWHVQNHRDQRFVAHGGLVRGMVTHVAIVPKLNLGIVSLSNSRDAYGSQGTLNAATARWIADRHLNAPDRNYAMEYLDKFRADRENAASKRERFLRRRSDDTQPSLPMEGYEGTYGDAAYPMWRVVVEDGRLLLRYLRAPKVLYATLEHWHYDTFLPIWNEIVQDYWPAHLVTFSLDAGGAARSIVFSLSSDEEEREYRRTSAPYA